MRYKKGIDLLGQKCSNVTYIDKTEPLILAIILPSIIMSQYGEHAIHTNITTSGGLIKDNLNGCTYML